MHSNKPRNFILHEKKPAECSLTLRHIGHTRTNNGWLFQTCGSIEIDLCFFSEGINVRDLPLSAWHCLTALPVKTCAFSSLMQQNACYCNIKWAFADLLPCYCYAIQTNSGIIRSRLSHPPLQAKEWAWLNCKLITA